MNIIKWFGMLAIMLAITGFVMAEETVSDARDASNELTTAHSQALSVRYDHLQCKVDFTNKQIETASTNIPGVDLTANKEELVQDMQELEIFVTEIDTEGFDEYINETLRPDLKNATDKLNEIKRNFRQYNLSDEVKDIIISDIKEAKEQYSECVSDKEVKMAQVMENHMEKWNEQLEKIIEKMNDRNITTANMTEIIAEINDRNVKLQELIANGNITVIREFMKEYRYSQFHYAARFEIARLNGYKEKLEPLAERYNMSEYLKNMDNKIMDAEKYAKEGYKYSEGERQKVWNNIKDAGQEIRATAKNINDERVKERQENINERSEQMRKISENRRERLNGSNNLTNDSYEDE
ncbi:MAG: hypothetical protein ACP5N1_07020 [Candidatus Woesearchaeota archaeon]